MKFKKTAYAFLAFAGIMSFASCDEVAEDDRYIKGEQITAERTVLLEDFTGQNCINCPDAHVVIEQLEEQYGDKLVAVSIHCGTFGIPVKRTNFDNNLVGLMTDEGNAIMETYGIQQFPMGVINMGSPQTFDLWATAVRNAIKVPIDIKITASAEYEPDKNDGSENGKGYFGNIKIKADVISESSRTANVQFWILENGIVAMQRSTAGTNQEYVHNNVFRAQVFEGLKGESVNFKGEFNTNVEGSIASRWTNKERWEINNLSVVVIVSDNTGVLQCAKVPVTVPAGE